MSLYAFVTLLTTDAYLPGALVAIQSVLEAEGPNPSTPFETVCLVTPATVSVESIKALRRNFSLVVGVEELRSGSSDNLELLGRQDLASTLTKLQLFRLIQFKKLIFLDADTLCLQPLSHLFKLDAPFSACPDAGWPDCFNSGMFVCNPSVQTFDGLVEMASQRGSWDGGDQGLLNDFFPDWNRLSFTYNVTPSAYYTYAPAYRRHGAEIKLVHFIGTDKPWYQASSRRTHIPSSSEGSGSGSSSSSSSSKDDGGAHDYASLLDRWFSVYQRYFGKASNTTFTFPTLQAVWDAPGGGHSRASYTPPSLEELKRQFQGIQAAHLAASSSSSSSTSLLSSAQQQQRGGLRSLEGHYVSMPLKPGRPDLLGKRVFIPHVPTTTTVQGTSPGRQPSPPIAPPHIVAPVPIRPGHQQGAPSISVHAASPEGGAVGGSSSSHQQERHHQREGQPHHHASYSSSSQDQQQQQQRAWSPQNVSWDPARSEPPKNDRPQMEAGFHYQAENAWDAPKHSSQHRSFFRAPAQYGSIPAVTHQNYSDVARASPDESKLKPVFPWEQYQQQQHQQQYQHHHHHQHYQHGHGGLPHASSSSGSYQDHYHQQQYHHNRPTRVFPPEESRKPTLTPTRPAPPPPTSPGSSRSHTPSHSQSYGQHQHKPAPSPVITDFANLSSAYTNAWDDVAGIRRYAKNLSGKGGDDGGRTGSGSRRGGTGSGSGGGGNQQQQRSSASHHHHHHQHSQSTSSQTSSAAPYQSHSRSASYQTSSRGSSLPDRDQRQRERTSSAATSGSGYDTGGEASSRDGDDEDEDDDEEGDGYLPHGGRGGGSAAASNKTRNASRGVSSPSYLGSGTAGSASISLNSGGSNGLRPDVNSVRLPSSRTSSSETITSSSGHMGLGTAAPPPGTQIPGLPDTSTGNYKPSRVSRVFDPSTATDVIRKEGLDALHRFVRSMEARGAAANGRQVDESLQ